MEGNVTGTLDRAQFCPSEVAVFRATKIFALCFLSGIPTAFGLDTGGTLPRFDFNRDTFSFQNDTLRAYSVDAEGRLHMHAREKPPEYSRRCFVLVRSTLQFRKFAEFDSRRPRLDDAGYRRLARTISRIPIWVPQTGPRIVVPGYADLRSFSKAHPKLLQDNLGAWWPNYFRFGNWRMAYPFPRIWQKNLADELKRKIDGGKVQAVFLTRFRPINHCLIVYGCQPRAGGGLVFSSYDPNDALHPRPLEFDAQTSSFLLGRTSYFNGGRVNATKAYILPWQ